MRWWLVGLVGLAGCEVGVCLPPGSEEPLPRDGHEVCADVRWGCSGDAQECVGSEMFEPYVFIKHAGRELRCPDGDCDRAWDRVEAWCREHPNCT